jgi:hypothetical protein
VNRIVTEETGIAPGLPPRPLNLYAP